MKSNNNQTQTLQQLLKEAEHRLYKNNGRVIHYREPNVVIVYFVILPLMLICQVSLYPNWGLKNEKFHILYK